MHEPPIRRWGRLQAHPEPKVHGDEGSQDHPHNGERQGNQLPVPGEDPGGVRQSVDKEPRTDAVERGALSLRPDQSEAVPDEHHKPQVDDPPDGKGEAHRHKEVGVEVGERAGVHSVEGQGVGEAIAHQSDGKTGSVQHRPEKAILSSHRNPRAAGMGTGS